MNININHLKYFVDTLRFNSVNKAAKKNHVSQPAISQGIRKLEDQVGMSLLVHKKNKIIPTQDGESLFSYSLEVFSSIEELEYKIQKLKLEVSGIVRLGCSNTIAKALIIPKLKMFEKKYPDVEFKIKVGKTKNQIDLLENNEIDLGVTIDNGQLFKFSRTPLYKGNFILVGRKSSMQRILTTEKRPEVDELVKSLKKNNSSLPSIEVESWDLLYEMAKNGLGYAFVPDFMLQSKDRSLDYNKQFKVPKIEYSIVSFFSKERRPSRATELFLNELVGL